MVNSRTMKQASPPLRIRRVITTASIIYAETAIRTGPARAFLYPHHDRPTRSCLQQRHTHDTSFIILFSSSANATAVEEAPSDTTAACTNSNELTFRSNFETESGALPLSCLPLREFFDDPKHISFGKSLPATPVPPTPELLEQWAAACRRVGASLPIPDDSASPPGAILSVRTAGISFPGLKLEWSALIGTTRVVQQSDDGNLPGLEFVLIRDETTARGARPLMWIYNKMNKAAPRNRPSSSLTVTEVMRDTTMLTRFGFHRSEEETITFRCSGYMEMRFRVPSAARRLVASDDAKKAVTEKRVSDLITRQIEKDMIRSVDHWEENFRSWAREHENLNLQPNTRETA